MQQTQTEKTKIREQEDLDELEVYVTDHSDVNDMLAKIEEVLSS